MLKCQIVGNLGQDPEMRYSAEGRPVLTFRVASNYRTRTQEGAWEDRTEWVRVRVVGQRAETLSQYLRKGSRVYVDGRLEARPWSNNAGQPQSGLEVFANDVEFLNPRDDNGQQPAPARAAAPKGQDDGDSDLEYLPF